MKRTMVSFALALGLCLGSCGSDGPPVITGEVTAAHKMPFHGPGGPGTEPMTITFMWTVVVRASDASDCVVQGIDTEIVEARSGEVVQAVATPNRALPEGQAVEFPLQQSGFFISNLFTRPWTGRSRVEVGCAMGGRQEVEIPFILP